MSNFGKIGCKDNKIFQFKKNGQGQPSWITQHVNAYVGPTIRRRRYDVGVGSAMHASPFAGVDCYCCRQRVDTCWPTRYGVNYRLPLVGRVASWQPPCHYALPTTTRRTLPLRAVAGPYRWSSDGTCRGRSPATYWSATSLQPTVHSWLMINDQRTVWWYVMIYVTSRS